MSTRINKKAVKQDMTKDAHANFMGGPSYDIKDPFFRLSIVGASSFFGEPKYYTESLKPENSSKPRLSLSNDKYKYLQSTLTSVQPIEWLSMNSAQITENTIDKCLDVDIERTLQVAVELRNDHNMRLTPQVIMVRAAMHKNAKGTGLVTKYAPDILKRGDEPATQLAYFLSITGNGKRTTAIPMSLRKSWKVFLESLNEYKLAKYKMSNRMVKTVDVVRLVHAHSPAIDKLIKNELKQFDTWENMVSASGSKKEIWEQSIEKMGHMALLRNLRNLVNKNVDPDLFVNKLVNTAESGKQLPFRYVSAYTELEKIGAPGKVLDAIEESMKKSFINLPTFKGNTISLVDNSGSAHGCPISEYSSMSVARIGNMMGVITGQASENGTIGVFGDRLKYFNVRKQASSFDQMKKVDNIGQTIGGSTENGIWLFWDDAIKNKKHWDNVFVYSDMQAGHGGLYGINAAHYSDYIWSGRYIDVPKLVAEYRRKVNPNVNVFLVQIAGYEDTLFPQFYNRTYILGGWSSKILNFADQLNTIFNK